MKRFSDFSNEVVPLDGDKARLEEIVDKPIVVTGCRIRKSRYSKNASGEYLTLQFAMEDKRFVCFTGSDVLIDQMKRYESEVPFEARIKRINRYFTLS